MRDTPQGPNTVIQAHPISQDFELVSHLSFPNHIQPQIRMTGCKPCYGLEQRIGTVFRLQVLGESDPDPLMSPSWARG